MKTLLIFILLTLSGSANAQWIKQDVNTTASLRGLSVVNEKVVWASGTGGTVIRTIDGGKTWKVMTVPGAEKLDFRDVEAYDANTAYILSIGNGELSRIYKTTDGGKTWAEQFRNKNEKAFFDALHCLAERVCIAMSDPFDGRFRLFRGELFYVGGPQEPLWDEWIPREMPAARKDEAAYAASGTCLTGRGNHLWIVTGGSAARVFVSRDDGLRWQAVETSFAKGTPGSGIFSIAMRDLKNGVIVGGNYEKPDEAKNNLALTTDGGRTWRQAKGLKGYRSGVAYVDNKTIVAVGTNGSDITRDGGKTWHSLGKENLNAVQSKGIRATWAVGPKGLIVKYGEPINIKIANKYHSPVGNVERVDLSHQEISTNCAPTNSMCSDRRVIQLSVSAPAFETTPIEYVYVVSGGRIVGEGANVEWDLATEQPGTYTITAKVCIPDTDPAVGCFGKTVTRQIVIR